MGKLIAVVVVVVVLVVLFRTYQRSRSAPGARRPVERGSSDAGTAATGGTVWSDGGASYDSPRGHPHGGHAHDGGASHDSGADGGADGGASGGSDGGSSGGSDGGGGGSDGGGGGGGGD